jgi:hypothetical protein
MDPKLWHLYPMEFYSALNKNESLLFAGKWMELENINLSEISQVRETKSHMFFLTHGLGPDTHTNSIMNNRSKGSSFMRERG